MVREAGIGTDVDGLAVGCEFEAKQTTAGATSNLLEGSSGTDPQGSVVLGAERIAADKRCSGRPNFVLPAELRVEVSRAGQHEHSRHSKLWCVRYACGRIAHL